MTTVINLRDRAAVDAAVRDGTFVRCDRKTPWGNPYSHLPKSAAPYRANTRGESIRLFRQWVKFCPDAEAQWIREHVKELKDKTLGCWCHPLPCHCGVLAEMADA